MKSSIVGMVLCTLLIAGGAVFFWLRYVGDRTQPQLDDAWFVDVTDASGLDFVHDVGDLSSFRTSQINGSGVGLFDFDGDGLLDIYLLTHGGPDSPSTNRLFKNMGNGTFKDVTCNSGLGIAGFNTGVAVGDVNNDGWPDVLVTQYGGVRLFLNNGDGAFTDVTEASGLMNPLWATSASFFDDDRDGWLDLVVVNYLDDGFTVCYGDTGAREYCGPGQCKGTVTKLFRNLGFTGKDKAPPARFKDVTVLSGLAKAPGPGLGVYCADFNGDGWPDIFVANDGNPNHLWINQKDGTFLEQAFAHGIAVDAMGQAQAGMGVAIGDVDGDGLLDIFVTHLAVERNTLWHQGPMRGNFVDKTARAGLLHSEWRGTGFGTLMGDFDHDGWLDIAVVNGAIGRGTATPNPALKAHLKEYSERNQLFRNLGQGKFQDISLGNPPFCGTPNVCRGLVQGDIFGTGALDLVVSPIAGRASIYRNNVAKGGHWLLVRAVDPRLKRDAYGAEIRVRAGDRQWLRLINPAYSFQCSNDPRAHFGLGSATSVDAIEVLWPDGRAEVFPGGSVNERRVLRRGEGKQK
jgi:enediyne biosynthesis protein E4